MSETKIQWPWKPLYTWNPVIGCARLCPYCYARKIATRFRMTPDFTKPVFLPERLNSIFKAGSHVFVGSMSDIEYWRGSWKLQVIEYCRRNFDVNFYFLSKNPCSYYGYSTPGTNLLRYDWPQNCHLGLTMTLEQNGREQVENVDTMMEYRANGMFLSIEPLLGKLSNQHSLLGRFKWVIVGAMSGPGATKPLPEWVDSIKRLNLNNVFWKPNIRALAIRPGEGR